MLPTAEILARHGYGSLLIDLRAHGLSDGDMVTYGYQEVHDVIAAFEYLKVRGDIDPDRIGALGRSMGGAAVIRGAARSDIPKFIVIESTFSSLSDLIEDTYAAISIFPQWPFADIIRALAENKVHARVEEVDLVQDLSQPSSLQVFLIHGAEDQLIPIKHHKRLADAIRDGGEFWIIPGMGHTSPAEFVPEEYERRLIRFLESTEANLEGVE
jgi:dipeptidyl aminopeptidase/acylaminoacyl peptidase